MSGENISYYGRFIVARATWFIPVLLVSFLFLFCCGITLQTFPHWPAAVLVKKYGVMLGLVAGFACLIPQLTRGAFIAQVSAKKLTLYFIGIGGLLAVLLLGPPHIPTTNGFGLDFAKLSSDYWSADYTDMRSVLLRRVVMPALAHLLGFRENTYIYFWFVIYFVALFLAVRFLIVQKLGFIEGLSILTSSLFAYELIVPGYNEVLILGLALFCLQRTTSFLDKWIILLLAMATHEVATAVIFLSVIFVSSKKDKDEWFVIFPLMIAIVLATGLAISVLQKGTRPSETMMVMFGKTPFQWFLNSPGRSAIAIFIAYKLYWILPVMAWREPKLRILSLTLFASIGLMLIAIDGSRLIQFTSLTLFLLAPHVLSTWTPKARLILAVANLIIPTFVIETYSPPIWGEGLYSLDLTIVHRLGLNGTVWQ